MIDIKITVKNDHANYFEKFESTSIVMDLEDPHLKSMIDKVRKSFNQPIEEVKIRATMVGGAIDWE